MRKHLSLRFWVSVGLFLLAAPAAYWGAKQADSQIMIDDVSVSMAQKQEINERSGLSASNEDGLENYFLHLRDQKTQVDWEGLYRDWFDYARDFFVQAFPDNNYAYDQYVGLYLKRTRKEKMWRAHCLHELEDAEMDEEFQEKVARGILNIQSEYGESLKQLLADQWGAFQRLHDLYGQEVKVELGHNRSWPL